MATANIRAIITAEDRASKVVQSFSSSVDKSSDKIVKSNQKTSASFNQILVATAGAGVAAHRLVGVINDTVQAANREQSALTGLASITRAFNQDTEKATKAAQELATDGLMTVGDAALGLKNLLAAGFNLDQATTLMKRFKDSAAFGRQSALDFGQAVTSATEGIKNGNSILVDNAGVTKNLSVILEEAGFSAQDLMRATTDSNVRMALFNGILKETNPQLGDAERLTGLFAGKQAQLSAKTTELKARIGEALQPVLTQMLSTIAPLVEKFARFAEDHPRVVSAFLLITTAGLGLLAVLGSIGLAVTALGPIFTAFSGVATGSMAVVTGAYRGMAALIASPLALPAIAVGAALASIAAVVIAHRNMMSEIDRGIASLRSNLSSFETSLNNALASGKINQTEYDRRLGAYKQSQAGTARSLADIAKRRAIGGPVQAGSPYMVGERGPELFVPEKSGSIVSNSDMQSPINITIQAGAFMGSQLDARKFALKIMEAYNDAKGMKGATI